MAYFVAKYIIPLNKNAFCYHYFQNNMYIAIGINHCMSIMKTDTLIRHIILRQLLLMAAILASTVIAEAWEVDSLASRLDMQRYLYPQEKIHVSTDKEHYMAGDTIWLRAFVADAATNAPVTASRYAYVELRDALGLTTDRVKLLARKGAYSGYISLPETKAEGEYMLTAYTMFMENAGEQYFFKKRIRVSSPFFTSVDLHSKLTTDSYGHRRLSVEYRDKQSGKPMKYETFRIARADGSTKKFLDFRSGNSFDIDDSETAVLVTVNDEICKYIKVPKVNDSIALDFFPEGGYLVPGKACKVAFKAIGADGYGRNVEGSVLDSESNVVASFASLHCGMGYFTFVPAAGEQYTARVDNHSYPLPMPSSGAVVLHIAQSRERHTMSVEAAGLSDSRKAQIVVQQQGRLLSTAEIAAGEVLTLSTETFPTGLMQILLLDEAGNALSQRLAFNFGNNPVPSLAADKAAYADREPVSISLTLDGFASRQGSVAVSVTDDRTVVRDSTISIATQMLLQSELRGHIEDPAYYFADASKSRFEALEALLLTQGWTRYDIPAVARGSYAEPLIPIEKGQEIGGTVKSKWRGKPLKDASVNIIAPSRMFFNATTTDSLGRFALRGMDFPDSTKFIVQALNVKGKNEMNFCFDSIAYPDIKVPRSLLSPSSLDDGNGADAEVFVSNEYTRMNLNGSMSVLLGEVVVQARKKKKAEDVFQALATRTFDYKAFETDGMTSYAEVLRRIAGIIIWEEKVFYRRSAVAFMIDGTLYEDIFALGPEMGDYGRGTPVPLSEIEMRVPFSIVKRIDFLRPNEAAMFGVKAGGGLIAIATKDGTELRYTDTNYNLKTITPLGYQKPAAFYSPRYDINQAGPDDGTDLRSTVYWNPNVIIEDGKSQFSFFATDIPGTSYTITVEGLTDQGEIIAKSAKIRKQ